VTPIATLFATRRSTSCEETASSTISTSRALHEIQRIVRPGGHAHFVEPLAHNPLLRVGRVLTPGARSVDEHPFTNDDWSTCGEIFPAFRHFERELVTVPLMPSTSSCRPAAAVRSPGGSKRWIDA